MIIYAPLLDFLGILVLLYAFVIIAENFMHSLVRDLQIQSIILGILIALVGWHLYNWSLIALSVLTVVFRGYVIPEILLKDQKKGQIWKYRELGTMSRHTLLVGIIGAIAGLIFYKVLYDLTGAWDSAIPFVVLIVGLLIIVMRKNAIAQISGYIVEENALLYIGIMLAPLNFLLEVGILLDVIGAVLLAVVLGAKKEYGPLEIEELSG